MSTEENRMIPLAPDTPLVELARAAAALGLRPVQQQGRLYLKRIRTQPVRHLHPLNRRKP